MHYVTYNILYVYVWYHGVYVRIKVTHRDSTETTECNFCKITVNHRDSNISTVIPNTHYIILKMNGIKENITYGKKRRVYE
jgi:hypothetical protein